MSATDPIWIEDAQAYPDAANKQARVRVVIGNTTGQPAAGQLSVGSESYNVASPAWFKTQTVEVKAPERRAAVEFTYQPGDSVPLWDEFQPALLRLDLKLTITAGGQSYADTQSRNKPSGARRIFRRGFFRRPH